MRWLSDKLQANFGYNGSYFRNDTNALTWQSPFKSFAAPVTLAPIGTITFTFGDSSHATMGFTINGVAGSKTISKMIF